MQIDTATPGVLDLVARQFRLADFGPGLAGADVVLTRRLILPLGLVVQAVDFALAFFLIIAEIVNSLVRSATSVTSLPAPAK